MQALRAGQASSGAVSRIARADASHSAAASCQPTHTFALKVDLPPGETLPERVGSRPTGAAAGAAGKVSRGGAAAAAAAGSRGWCGGKVCRGTRARAADEEKKGEARYGTHEVTLARYGCRPPGRRGPSASEQEEFAFAARDGRWSTTRGRTIRGSSAARYPERSRRARGCTAGRSRRSAL